MKYKKSIGSYSGRMEDFRIREIIVCDRCEIEKPEDDILWFKEICPNHQTTDEKRIVKRQLIQAAKYNRSHIRRHQDAIRVLENRALELEEMASDLLPATERESA